MIYVDTYRRDRWPYLRSHYRRNRLEENSRSQSSHWRQRRKQYRTRLSFLPASGGDGPLLDHVCGFYTASSAPGFRPRKECPVLRAPRCAPGNSFGPHFPLSREGSWNYRWCEHFEQPRSEPCIQNPGVGSAESSEENICELCAFRSWKSLHFEGPSADLIDVG